MSSFRIDKRMLPESPESFMRNWENQSSGPKSGASTKSPMKDTIKKEPVMVHHTKGKSEHDFKTVTPDRNRMYMNGGAAGDIMEKINEGKEMYRSPLYAENEYNGDIPTSNTLFIYDCGHCLSGNMKGGPNPRKINSLCPACLSQQKTGSAGKWSGNGSAKIRVMN